VACRAKEAGAPTRRSTRDEGVSAARDLAFYASQHCLHDADVLLEEFLAVLLVRNGGPVSRSVLRQTRVAGELAAARG
jgi:hypothetical protein